MPEFKIDAPITIAAYYRDSDTFSPVAVGSSVISSTEMLACGMKGKGVNILHLYRDCLWFDMIF
jgi:translation initiation factor 2D